MESCTHVFQISGLKARDKKSGLVRGIQQLGGKHIGGSVYENTCTHLIIPKVLPSEKFMAACAAGKWVVTPDYVLDSVKKGSWLAEGPYEVALSTASKTPFYPVKQWREKVASGKISGAFQGWTVLLMVQKPTRRAMFTRLLKAGGAEVYDFPPPSDTSISHVLAKPFTENSRFRSAPCYPVSFLVQHLFGSIHVDMNFSITDDDAIMKPHVVDLSTLEAEVKNYVLKQEGFPRLLYPQFSAFYEPHHSESQVLETVLRNVGSMIECGLFNEALESLGSAVFPGLLPPASYLKSLLKYAQWGMATPAFLMKLNMVMDRLLIVNPPWQAPNTAQRYFTQVLQCPRCKMGLWPFLATAISYCLSSGDTCHPLPGPALPTLVQFHHDILALFLRIFQGELQSVIARDFVLDQEMRAASASTSGSLLYGTFWTVLERSTLLSSNVKKLLRLIVQAASVDYTEKDEKGKLCVANTLLELLSVLVEFWFLQHFKLNQSLVQKGLKDLSEHLAVISQDLSPSVLAELVTMVHSSRLKLMLADAIFRNLCCRQGFTVGDEPLSLNKMVFTYLPALGSLAQSLYGTPFRNGPTSHSCTSQGTGCRPENTAVNETCSEKENIPRGLNRVNAAGETLLHRACKRNQVEMVLQILALPGTDIDVKDHAGWTPLHEACNHGSVECVEALLRHYPTPVLNSQVGGVSPLYDALLNGHVDIAKILLEHAGSVLLWQTDNAGQTPLDLVSAPSQRAELLRCAQVGDSKCLRNKDAEVSNLPLMEAGSTLLAVLMISYLQEMGLSLQMQSSDKPHSLCYRLVRALEKESLQKVTESWTDQRAVRLVQDVETLWEMSSGRYLWQVSECVRKCKGETTLFLMEKLEDLSSWAKALIADL
ncbi:SMC5-SMC6 complex localization factor protein 1 isoform 1-T1 [Pholidichthys leucotaenia]